MSDLQLNILVADDEETVLKLCEQMLRRGGYNVLPAGNGQQALDLFEHNGAAIHLALLDVIMPDINGVEVARRIHSLNPGTPIVLMTGYGPKEIARVVGNTNPFRVIWKPFKTDSLLRMIENALGDISPTT